MTKLSHSKKQNLLSSCINEIETYMGDGEIKLTIIGSGSSFHEDYIDIMSAFNEENEFILMICSSWVNDDDDTEKIESDRKYICLSKNKATQLRDFLNQVIPNMD